LSEYQVPTAGWKVVPMLSESGHPSNVLTCPKGWDGLLLM
jgi:hypothetical protein